MTPCCCPPSTEAVATARASGPGAAVRRLASSGHPHAAASRLGLELRGARILDPCDATLRERFAQEYAARRAHKGVTVDQARDVVTDVGDGNDTSTP